MINGLTIGQKRDLYWDSTKFFLIFLVVYGHMIMPEYQSGNRINMALFNFIYMFHMPLFIFISGRFSHIHDKKRYKCAIFRILESLIVLQIGYSIIYYCQNGIFPIDMFWKPKLHLWYLLSLVWWRLIILITPPRFLAQRKQVLITSFCVTLISGLVPIGDELAIQRTMAFFFFFMLGYESNDIDVISMIKRIPLWISILLLIILVCLFIIIPRFAIPQGPVFLCNLPYWTNGSFVYRFLCRMALLPASIFISCIILRIMPCLSFLSSGGGQNYVHIRLPFLFNRSII